MGQQNIGKWAITSGMDASGVSSGMRQMVQDTHRLRQEVSAGFTGLEQSVDGSLGGVGASLSLFGMRVGFQSLSIAAVVNTIKQVWQGLSETLESDLELGFLADQLDMSIEFLSSLQTVASENSVTAEQFSSAMQRFNQTLGQANLGSAEAVRSFEQIGLEWETLRDMAPEQQFLAVARALADTENRSVRARAAMELFGRGGAGGMLRFVEDLDRSLGEVQSRSAFQTREGLANFREMDDAVDRISTTWNQMWRDFLNVTAPNLTRVLDVTGMAFEGWRRILFHTEANPFAPPERSELNNQFAMLQMARQFRDTGDESFLDLDRLRQAGYTIPEQFQLGGPQGILDAHAILQQLDPLYRENADAAREFMLSLEELRAATQEANRDAAAAARIIEQGRTPAEAFNFRMEELTDLLERGYLDVGQFARGTEGALQALDRATRQTQQARLPQMLEFGSAAAASFLNQSRAAGQERMTEAMVDARDLLRRLVDRLMPLLGSDAAQVVSGILQGGARS